MPGKGLVRSEYWLGGRNITLKFSNLVDFRASPIVPRRAGAVNPRPRLAWGNGPRNGWGVWIGYRGRRPPPVSGISSIQSPRRVKNGMRPPGRADRMVIGRA